MKYLLDTNIISAISKGRNARLSRRMRGLSADQYATSAIVAGELRFGAAKVGNAAFAARISQSLAATSILPIDNDVTEHYGMIRAALEKAGKPIGQNDTWIAAHAAALDLILVTDNVGEFSRIPSLRVENWLRDEA